MAYIGLRHPVVATFSQSADGSMPTYESAHVLGRAITANVTKNHNNNPLYADDIIDEDDNSLTGMTLTFGVNDIEEQDIVRLFGSLGEYDPDTGAFWWEDTGEPGRTVGFGYIRVRRLQGVDWFEAVWYWKVLFTDDAEESKTKGETIEWQTPTITGRVHGVYIDDSGIPRFRRRMMFKTMLAAQLWLDGMANFSVGTNSDIFASLDVTGVTWDIMPTRYALNYMVEHHIPLEGSITVNDGNDTSTLTFEKGVNMSSLETGMVTVYNKSGVSPTMTFNSQTGVIRWGLAGKDTPEGALATFSVKFSGYWTDGVQGHATQPMQNFFEVKIRRLYVAPEEP